MSVILDREFATAEDAAAALGVSSRRLKSIVALIRAASGGGENPREGDVKRAA